LASPHGLPKTLFLGLTAADAGAASSPPVRTTPLRGTLQGDHSNRSSSSGWKRRCGGDAMAKLKLDLETQHMSQLGLSFQIQMGNLNNVCCEHLAWTYHCHDSVCSVDERVEFSEPGSAAKSVS